MTPLIFDGRAAGGISGRPREPVKQMRREQSFEQSRMEVRTGLEPALSTQESSGRAVRPRQTH